ncbi:MAG: ORF6N domain-containing protein [Bacteroidales bacterium]|nr:ORF6N domain-containing protein [Bacteroidales bacterium]
MQEITTTINLDIKSKIYTIRDKQVMLDEDLAELYDVEPKRLNEQVKRNIERFPEKFRFQLTQDEYEILRSQFATLRLGSDNEWGKHRKYLPYVFTEQGLSMLSTVLKSKTAIDVSIKIMDSFVNMRKLINSNNLYTEQLKHIEKRQLSYEIKSDENFSKIFKALETNDTTYSQGIFFDRQIFDAHNFVSDLIRSATSSIVLIDNFVDDSTLLLFSKNQNIDVTIHTNTFTKALKLDLEKYNKQYKDITIQTNKKFHDRFLIIDNKEVYHIGASLKDLGKKTFAFSKMEDLAHHLLEHI